MKILGQSASLKLCRTVFVLLIGLVAVAVTLLSVPQIQAQASPPTNEVFAWGLASSGQLGISGAQRIVPTPSPQLAAIHAEHGFVYMSAGAYHNIALASDRTMWVWGQGTYGQLGRAGNTANVTAPVQVPALTAIAQAQGIRQIASGSFHNIMLTDAGNVYVWGRNNFGQLGIIGANLLTPTRNLTLSARNVERVFAGSEHSIAVTREGYVYVWGNGANGRLGTGLLSTQNTPTRNQDLTAIAQAQGIRHLSVASSHNILVSNSGRAYVWGNNTQGRLGTGSGSNYYLLPTEVPALTALNIQQVATGSVHSVVIASSGRVYGFGGNGAGQLGLGQGSGNPPTPEEIVPLTTLNNTIGIRKIHTRPQTAHTFIVLDNGQVYFQGHGGFGRAGNDSTDNVFVPTETWRVSELVQGGAHLFLGGWHTIAFSPITTGGDFPLTKVLEKPYGTPRPASLNFEFRMRATSFNNNSDTNVINERFPTNSTNMVRDITIDASSASSTRVVPTGNIVELTASTDLLEGINFNRRGVFEWEIYEIIPATSPVNPPSNLVYSLAKYELRVYVRERAIFGGEFYIYAITVHRLRNADGTIPTNGREKVGMNDEAEITFTNRYTRLTGANQHLNVTKYIEGNFANTDETFSFTATLNRHSFCTLGPITARVFNQNNVEVATHNFTTANPTVANITLSHNWRLVFDPITIGSSFVVIEAACPVHIARVRVYSHAHPTIPQLLENTVVGQPRTTNTHIIGANTNAANFINAHQYMPPTGLVLGAPTYVVVPLFTAGIALAATFARRARKRIEDMPAMY